MYAIGQKVACLPIVDAWVKPGDRRRVLDFYIKGGHALEPGRVYTVRGVFEYPSGQRGLHLNEIVNPVIDGQEDAYDARRFAPLPNDDDVAQVDASETVDLACCRQIS